MIYVEIVIYGMFRCELELDPKDRLRNGKVCVRRPIWNGMFKQLQAEGYEPEVKNGKIYIRLRKG